MTKTKPASATSVRMEENVDEIVSSIGPKVKRLRQEQRLSLQQLAVKAEVSAAAIHKIERNDMVPTITTLLKVASALDRPVTFFVEQDGRPDPVAFTPASDRPAVYTPHAGLTLAGVSGPFAPFRFAAALATDDPGADCGDKPLAPRVRSWSSCSKAR
jgi:transcriptional regulator with XRE-family HTH domain